jgi:predicted RNA-binding protein (virulence factor B family)
MEDNIRDHHLKGNTLELGVYHKLEILRDTSVGLYLGDDKGNEILLPNKYVPQEFEIGSTITVFVYLDSKGRHIASTLDPKLIKGEFALLKCKQVTSVGAFMEIGLEKDLMVPFEHQERKMKEGKHYIVYMFLDDKSDRLIGSSKTNKFLEEDNIDLKQGQEVEVIVDRRTDLGYRLIIENKYRGFIFNNQVFGEFRYGQKLTGFVKEIRDDKKIDITFQMQGFESIGQNRDKILDYLEDNDGYLDLNDKSSPEEIREKLSISKKLFKKSVGMLYKQKLIEIKDDGIYLIQH